METFFVESWLEHLRQHQRVTNADRVLRSLLSMGLPADRVSSGQTSDPNVQANEVRIYVR